MVCWLPRRPTMTTGTDTLIAEAKTPHARRVAAASDAPRSSAAKTATKSDTVIKLLLRAKGATPTELSAATDWQPHSLRAFLSGLRKKGRDVTREERKGGGFAYRIIVAPTAAAAHVDGSRGPASGDGTSIGTAQV